MKVYPNTKIDGTRLPVQHYFVRGFYTDMGKAFNEAWRYKEYRKANGLLPKKKKKKGERTLSDTWTTMLTERWNLTI